MPTNKVKITKQEQPQSEMCRCGCPRLTRSGTFYLNKWFCSNRCVQDQKEQDQLDLLADNDGTDYRGRRTN